MTLGLNQDTLTQDELYELIDLLSDLSDCDDLTDWEVGFIDDMSMRVGRYERRTLISDAQQEQLDRMQAKYIGLPGQYKFF